LFEKFRARLAARGARGMVGLQRSFKIMDDNNSLTLDKQEFIKAIKDFRVDISESDLGKLYDAFDRDGSGELSYDEFLRSVRGPMN
jgi:Ca2+-binding EF-hand superfamily protein